MGSIEGDVFLAREWSWGAWMATCFLQGSGRGEHRGRRVSCKGVVVGGMDGDVFLAREWSWGALRATCFLQRSGCGGHGWRRVSCKGVVVGSI